MMILKKVKNSLSSWKKFYKAHILYIVDEAFRLSLRDNLLL